MRISKETVFELNSSGIRVVPLGPTGQFRFRLPSLLNRASVQREARSDDCVLPEIFEVDAMMKSALPTNGGFNQVSVLDARLCASDH